jgi:uncharacterized membrane protein
MKKTYLFFVALAAMLFGAMDVSAEEVSLETVPFWAHETAWVRMPPRIPLQLPLGLSVNLRVSLMETPT